MTAQQFSPSIRGGLRQMVQGMGLKLAKWAGFNGANPGTVQAPATRLGTNPNSTFANWQRVRLSLEGENAVKNTSFAINYVQKRMMYCSARIKYAPDTGDSALDEAVSAYLKDQFKRMGVNCSMEDAYSRVSDVFLPQSGDAMLQWYRDVDGLRLLEITADRIGEQYIFGNPKMIDGCTYVSGVFLDGPDAVAYRIYDRAYDTVYVNPHKVGAWDCIFFKDDFTGGVRGVSKFAAALEDINSRYQIFKATKDTMQQQSKIAAISSNNSGAPADFEYQQQNNLDGSIQYVESFADGAVVKYQFNGDSYQVLKAEHPTPAFIGGLKYADASSALATGFPYEFLFSATDAGGAPTRAALEVAGKEIVRLRERVHRPRLDMISYVVIMDAVERGKLPARANITRGEWMFGTLPSVDAYRDSKADIDAILAGIESRDDVILRNGGPGFEKVARRNQQEAIKIAKLAQDANRIMKADGYEPTIQQSSIASDSKNPQPMEASPQKEPALSQS